MSACQSLSSQIVCLSSGKVRQTRRMHVSSGKHETLSFPKCQAPGYIRCRCSQIATKKLVGLLKAWCISGAQLYFLFLVGQTKHSVATKVITIGDREALLFHNFYWGNQYQRMDYTSYPLPRLSVSTITQQHGSSCFAKNS